MVHTAGNERGEAFYHSKRGIIIEQTGRGIVARDSEARRRLFFGKDSPRLSAGGHTAEEAIDNLLGLEADLRQERKQKAQNR